MDLVNFQRLPVCTSIVGAVQITYNLTYHFFTGWIEIEVTVTIYVHL